MRLKSHSSKNGKDSWHRISLLSRTPRNTITVEIITINMEVAPAVVAIQETTEEATTSNLHTEEVGAAGTFAVDAATMIITDSSTIEITPFYISLFIL